MVGLSTWIECFKIRCGILSPPISLIGTSICRSFNVLSVTDTIVGMQSVETWKGQYEAEREKAEIATKRLTECQELRWGDKASHCSKEGMPAQPRRCESLARLCGHCTQHTHAIHEQLITQPQRSLGLQLCSTPVDQFTFLFSEHPTLL